MRLLTSGLRRVCVSNQIAACHGDPEAMPSIARLQGGCMKGLCSCMNGICSTSTANLLRLGQPKGWEDNTQSMAHVPVPVGLESHNLPM